MTREQLLEEALAQLDVSLDEALATFGVTHKQWRRYLRRQGKQLPAVTPGLVDEVLAVDGTNQGLATMFNLQPSQIAVIKHGTLKGTKPDTDKARQQRDADIYADLTAGLTTVQISHKHGITQSRVSQIAREMGLRGRKHARRRKPLTAEETVDIVADYENGMHKADIAKKHERSIVTIYKVLHDAGIH